MHTKLTEKTAAEIIGLMVEGKTNRELAAKFNTTVRCMEAVRAKRSWKQISEGIKIPYNRLGNDMRYKQKRTLFGKYRKGSSVEELAKEYNISVDKADEIIKYIRNSNFNYYII